MGLSQQHVCDVIDWLYVCMIVLVLWPFELRNHLHYSCIKGSSSNVVCLHIYII